LEFCRLSISTAFIECCRSMLQLEVSDRLVDKSCTLSLALVDFTKSFISLTFEDTNVEMSICSYDFSASELKKVKYSIGSVETSVFHESLLSKDFAPFEKFIRPVLSLQILRSLQESKFLTKSMGSKISILNAPILFPIEQCIFEPSSWGLSVQLLLDGKNIPQNTSLPPGAEFWTKDGEPQIRLQTDSIAEAMKIVRSVSISLSESLKRQFIA
jgi:hypothetical protein